MTSAVPVDSLINSDEGILRAEQGVACRDLAKRRDVADAAHAPGTSDARGKPVPRDGASRLFRFSPWKRSQSMMAVAAMGFSSS
jgi:hypothetical protein